jgi:hypothetical protein
VGISLAFCLPGVRSTSTGKGVVRALFTNVHNGMLTPALAGHKSIKTTQRYLGVSTELRREAVNRLHFPEADQPAE